MTVDEAKQLIQRTLHQVTDATKRPDFDSGGHSPCNPIASCGFLISHFMVSSHYNKFYRLRLCFIACILSVAFAAGQCKCNTNSAVATVGVEMNTLTCSVPYNSHPVISPLLPSGLAYELTTIRKTTNITVSGVALHPIGLTKFLVSDGSFS